MVISKTSKLREYLQRGNSVTAKQITSMFGLRHPASAIRHLREQGLCIYTNEKTLVRTGQKVVAYKVGSPTRRMVRVAKLIFGARAFA
jgi:predicted transcriptional regulator